MKSRTFSQWAIYNCKIMKIHQRNLKIVFSRTTGPISTKLSSKHHWVKGKLCRIYEIISRNYGIMKREINFILDTNRLSYVWDNKYCYSLFIIQWAMQENIFNILLQKSGLLMLNWSLFIVMNFQNLVSSRLLTVN